MIQELRFYLAMFWRRLPLFLLLFVAIATVGVMTAFTLPAVYRAQMRLVVESSQIPGALAQSTVNIPAQEQLQLFETRLLTRDNLLDIAGRLRPFPDMPTMSPDEIVQAMRAATKITTSTGRDSATLMSVSFESKLPGMTVQVLDSYLTFLLQDDAQFRAERAGQTQSFFEQEVTRLSGEMNRQSSKIVEFKNQNSDALPDSLDYHRQLLVSYQNALTQLDREKLNLEDQKQRLTQVFNATGSVASSSGAGDPQAQYLQGLRNQLAELESIYAPTSARVTTLRNRITQLEAAQAKNSSGSTDTVVDPAKAMFDMQISDIDNRLTQIAQERSQQEDNIKDVQGRIGRTPGNAIALETLQRDYDNIQAQYNRAADSLARASTGERIETLSKGQRISVIERPSAPTEPVKPNRKKLAAMSILGGFLFAAGVILALDFLSGTIRRSKDMVNALGIVPMVTIPIMRLPAERRRIVMLRLLLCLLIGIIVPLAAWLIHTYYMPFDELIPKIAARIGFRL